MRRIGVDIGGTFTDGVIIDEAGQIRVAKTPSTPKNFGDAFVDIVESFLEKDGVAASDIAEVRHASTVGTNALLERKGARVGLLVTAGFRDILEIGRQVRHELYNLFTLKPPALVERRHSHEIRERIDYKGDIHIPINTEDVLAAIRSLRTEGVSSLVICFLHSYENPEHEQLAAEIVRREWPEAMLSVSSDIAAEIREYWRASTSAVNAYIAPSVNSYLDEISERLGQLSVHAPIGIMHSGGGIEGIQNIRKRPFQMIESGPAAGVAAAAYFSRRLGFRKGLSFDMGGTTAKAGLIIDGASKTLTEFEVAGSGHSGSSVAKASGYPVLGEVVDLVEVGAGGGSIAWIDDGGHLRVGPKGAGAQPGPACYGRGGNKPTITDANLLLGRLDASHFLGGTMKLDGTAAEYAIKEACADPLGLGIHEAAVGILEIADATMMGALRLVSIERGYDPREFCLVAFGGAGPVHAADIAQALSIPDILVPPSPGVASALGLLLSDVRHDVRLTKLLPLLADSIDQIAATLITLRERLCNQISDESLPLSAFAFSEYVEARYRGQSAKLRLDDEISEDPAGACQRLHSLMNREHKREYGYCVESEQIEIVTVGMSAVAPNRIDPTIQSTVPSGQVKGSRPVHFRQLNSLETIPVYDRGSLLIDHEYPGPLVIEEYDSTTIVPPSFTAVATDYGVLHLRAVADSQGSHIERAR